MRCGASGISGVVADRLGGIPDCLAWSTRFGPEHFFPVANLSIIARSGAFGCHRQPNFQGDHLGHAASRGTPAQRNRYVRDVRCCRGNAAGCLGSPARPGNRGNQAWTQWRNVHLEATTIPAGCHADWLRNMSIAEIRDLGDEQSAIAAATIRLACDRAEPHELSACRIWPVHWSWPTAPRPVLAQTAVSTLSWPSPAQSTRLTNAEIRLQAETVEVLWSQLGGDFNAQRATAEHLALVRAVAEDRSQQGQQLVLEHIRAQYPPPHRYEACAELRDRPEGCRMSQPQPVEAALSSICDWFREASAATILGSGAHRPVHEQSSPRFSRLRRGSGGTRRNSRPHSFRSIHFACGSGATFSSARVTEGQGLLEWWTPGSRGAEKLVLDSGPGWRTVL